MFIYINRAVDYPVLHHCMMGGVIAALGLTGIFTEPQRSFDKIDGEPILELSIDRQILIRTLYDPRIQNGMAVSDAVALAKTIIPELVQAVNERGITALHQGQ